ncbi:MAG: thioredoxin family protein [Labilithrix sp.]|nr:thioredoxin family protein [Labilithrix sp.]MCW5809507.1 thioredoxin family protein [Labilithrix sp.]
MTATATTATATVGCSARTREPATTSHATTSTSTAASSTTSSREVLPFIHDDYPRALAQSKKEQKPLFVDAWAPWCHSCQSLRTYVLTDPSLAPLASEFVWLSVDTEKDVNARWVEQHPHDALPTLWVVDPATDRPLLKWAGTATAAELRALLGNVLANRTDGFARGNQALAAGDSKTAIAEHRAALTTASKEQRPRIVEALVTELSLAKEHAACADLAAEEAAALPPGTSRATVLVGGLDCARTAKKDEARDRLLALAVRDASARDDALLPDDRSAIYQEVVTTKKESGDAAGAKAAATEWAAYLEDAVKRAASKDARAALDPWLVAVYLALGEPARALPHLEASARDFPQDYNPPARLGRVYLALNRLAEAEQATDRAIALVYGPRAMRVYELRADIAKARGDRAAETRALEEALAKSEKAVLTAGQKKVRDTLEKRLNATRTP